MERLGWRVESQQGSHRKLSHVERGGVLIVAFHDSLGRNSVRRVLRQVGITEEEFLAVL